MVVFSLFNNFNMPVCAFSSEGKIIFRNKYFYRIFYDFKSLDKFKKRFNFSLCSLSIDNIKDETPIDLLLQSNENFHTVCTYQNKNDEYIYYYIYTFMFNEIKVAVFKDITLSDKFVLLENRYKALKKSYDETKKSTIKFEKLKEHAQTQVLKMGIINKISLIIRETNNIDEILNSVLNEIQNLFGSFRTYFAIKEKNHFKISYIISDSNILLGKKITFEESIIDGIKNKNIMVNVCLKEYIDAKELMPKCVKRVIIPIYHKNKLLGIIITLTKQQFNENENTQILQSIAVQLSSAIIQADLIHKLDNKNKKLAKTLNKLKNTQIQLINTEKMASIGHLAAGIAHEINTPLASINSNSNIINKIIDENKNISSKHIELIKELNLTDIEASKRISGIVKSLKRFVRLDETELQNANINNELDLTLKLTAFEIKDNIKIVKNYSELPPIKCYVNMMNQVFMNLIVNACHSINEYKKDGLITIYTGIENNNLIVKIKDNGCGIAAKNKNKIFSAGFTTKSIGKGTGIGLSISKKIVEMHNGNISFTSRENEGSEFTISIPI